MFQPKRSHGKHILPGDRIHASEPQCSLCSSGPSASATVSRNSFNTPGFGVLNMFRIQELPLHEGKYLQAKVDVFNILKPRKLCAEQWERVQRGRHYDRNHNGGYVQTFNPNFLNAPRFFSGGIRSMTLGLKFGVLNFIFSVSLPGGRPNGRLPFFLRRVRSSIHAGTLRVAIRSCIAQNARRGSASAGCCITTVERGTRCRGYGAQVASGCPALQSLIWCQ